MPLFFQAVGAFYVPGLITSLAAQALWHPLSGVLSTSMPLAVGQQKIDQAFSLYLKKDVMKPISNTAFYCCGVRMQDAETANPVCQDTYAKVFMNEAGMRIFSDFQEETNPNAGNVARHRIIDDCIRQALVDNPDLRIVLIGAGFDSRAYRLDGGIWLELDEPQIIAYKNERLPVEACKNRLQRIAIDFETESLEARLQAFSTDEPVIVVIEGVFIYLHEDAVRQTLQTLHRLFPAHKLICDLMTEKFFNKYSLTLQQKLGRLGADFRFTLPNPAELFCRCGYQVTQKHSIVAKAVEYGSVKAPMLLLKLFMKTLVHGYSIFVFESALRR